MTGYTLFRKDWELDIKGGGVLLYVKDCLNANEVKFKSDFPEQVGVRSSVMGIENSLLVCVTGYHLRMFMVTVYMLVSEN